MCSLFVNELLDLFLGLFSFKSPDLYVLNLFLCFLISVNVSIISLVRPRWLCKAAKVTRCKRSIMIWVILTRYSGYLFKTSTKALPGKRRIVVSSTAFADTVLYGFSSPFLIINFKIIFNFH